MTNDAERCRSNGWGPGTRLAGDEGFGVTVLEITAVGESKVLAKMLIHNGKPSNGREGLWTLGWRDWRVVEVKP